MDSPRVCWKKRSQPPGKSKHRFSLYGEPFRYVFLLMWGGGLYHCLEALLLLFLYVGAFLLRFSPNVGPFSPCGCYFRYFFLHVVGVFVFMWGFYGLTLPYEIFCGRMQLCNLHPMSSAITYSGHCVPNKANCNTRLQFTIAIK